MTEEQVDRIFEGKTVEEAIERGLQALGVNRDDVEVEILQKGSRGFLGIGATPARVLLIPKEAEVTEESAPEAPEQEEDTDLEQYAARMLEGILQRMGFDAQVHAYWGTAEPGEKRPLVLNIEGRDLGLLIGHRAETLSALQYLMRAIVNQYTHRWMNIVVDVEHYRKRRKKNLERLAQRMAEQVARTGRPVVLEAMPARDRRIIHIALRDHPDVYTVSVGKEPRRKVTIRPKSELQEQQEKQR
ncbi:MAG: protein jag [Chloroflexi bacterium]|nr:protein jag [Chloroflexota bacterium]